MLRNSVDDASMWSARERPSSMANSIGHKDSEGFRSENAVMSWSRNFLTGGGGRNKDKEKESGGGLLARQRKKSSRRDLQSMTSNDIMSSGSPGGSVDRPSTVQSADMWSEVKPIRHVRSYTDFHNIQQPDRTVLCADNEHTEEHKKALLRRTQSHPNPRSSGSTFETVPHDQHKRVNLNMISRPVLVPEGREDFEKLEEDEKYDHKQDKVFTRRVVHAVGKNFGREKKKKVKDGVVVFKGHPSWSIVLAFQVGLKSTSEMLCSTEPPPELVGGDDTVDIVMELQATVGAVQNEHDATHTSWIHHAPVLYKKVRECFGINDRDFIDSVAAESKIRELPTPGRSGALFYITDDEEYFIKTINKVEEEKLQSMLSDYYKHILKYPKTLLTKFLANFYMKTRKGRHIRLVAMGSIFRNGLYIDKKYDLKGSVLNRFATEEEKKKDFVTLKDLDLDTVFFDPQVLEDLLNMLEVDTEFLAGRQIMDYSLLMGFSEVLPGEKTFEDLYGEQERNAPWIFGYQMDSNQKVRVFRISLGIIDILQGFTMKKRAEFLSKTMRYCATNQMSVNPPDRYRRRFMTFMRETFQPLKAKPPSLQEASRLADIATVESGSLSAELTTLLPDGDTTWPSSRDDLVKS